MKKFYLHRGRQFNNPNRYEEEFFISTEPQRTNQSGEELIEGWLGTTNDYDRLAEGEFESLDDAKKRAEELAFEFDFELTEFTETDDGDLRAEAYSVQRGDLYRWSACGDEWHGAELADDVFYVYCNDPGGETVNMDEKLYEEFASRLEGLITDDDHATADAIAEAMDAAGYETEKFEIYADDPENRGLYVVARKS